MLQIARDAMKFMFKIAGQALITAGLFSSCGFFFKDEKVRDNRSGINAMIEPGKNSGEINVNAACNFVEIKKIVQAQCTSCHSAQNKFGDFVAADANNWGADAAGWKKVIGAMYHKAMPPPASPQLDTAQLKVVEVCAIGNAAAQPPPTLCTNPGENPITPMRRLDRASFINTLSAIFGAPVVTALNTELSGFPEDPEKPFSSFASTVTSAHSDGIYKIAMAASNYALNTPSVMTTYASCFAGKSLSNPPTSAW